MTIRTIIVDDEPLVRSSIVRALRRDKEIEVVCECGDGIAAIESNGRPQVQGEAARVRPTDAAIGASLPWGILEASRRISVVRSASAARTKELRNRPTPPRDLEARFAKNIEEELRGLPEVAKEVHREEMQ